MKLRTGVMWWLLAAGYIAACGFFIHEYFSPFPIRATDSLTVIQR